MGSYGLLHSLKDIFRNKWQHDDIIENSFAFLEVMLFVMFAAIRLGKPFLGESLIDAIS